MQVRFFNQLYTGSGGNHLNSLMCQQYDDVFSCDGFSSIRACATWRYCRSRSEDGQRAKTVAHTEPVRISGAARVQNGR
ncbi:hypothetical protein BG55_16905 [Erwinia mallotivora]|uniref:Uncharacterized protein n=1 Tax=Erwinia mallotivora TaxID=69222 RepID=A0A014N4X3_9GAMM|nr:hypothetical protein BG55_16905 [Erwinia mallotivora]